MADSVIKKTAFLGFSGGQWLGIRLAIQGTLVESLVREDPTCHGATKTVHHNICACAQSPQATATEPMCCSY